VHSMSTFRRRAAGSKWLLFGNNVPRVILACTVHFYLVRFTFEISAVISLGITPLLPSHLFARLSIAEL
jgi:hypothetical protein